MKMAAIAGMALVIALVPVGAQAGGKIEAGENQWVSVGGGLKSSVNFKQDAAPSGEHYSKDFKVDNARLYFNGQAAEGVFATMNTEVKYVAQEGVSVSDARMRLLDGIVKFEFWDELKIWAGRTHPAQDRAGLDGPYYLLQWDYPGIVSRMPNILAGRDDGIGLWGLFMDKHLRYQIGAFEGKDGAPNKNDNLLYAARLVYNVLDPEPPVYYNSSTYFGSKNILALGGTVQAQNDGGGTADAPGNYLGWNVDLLYESPFDFGTVTAESGFYGYDFDVEATTGTALYVQAGYLMPSEIGVGKLQPSVRFQQFNSDEDGKDVSRIDINLGYIIAGHNGKVYLGYATNKPEKGDSVGEFKVGAQIQF